MLPPSEFQKWAIVILKSYPKEQQIEQLTQLYSEQYNEVMEGLQDILRAQKGFTKKAKQLKSDIMASVDPAGDLNMAVKQKEEDENDDDGEKPENVDPNKKRENFNWQVGKFRVPLLTYEDIERLRSELKNKTSPDNRMTTEIAVVDGENEDAKSSGENSLDNYKNCRSEISDEPEDSIDFEDSDEFEDYEDYEDYEDDDDSDGNDGDSGSDEEEESSPESEDECIEVEDDDDDDEDCKSQVSESDSMRTAQSPELKSAQMEEELEVDTTQPDEHSVWSDACTCRHCSEKAAENEEEEDDDEEEEYEEEEEEQKEPNISFPAIITAIKDLFLKL